MQWYSARGKYAVNYKKVITSLYWFFVLSGREIKYSVVTLLLTSSNIPPPPCNLNGLVVLPLPLRMNTQINSLF